MTAMNETGSAHWAASGWPGDMPQPRLEFAFRIYVTVGAPIDLGADDVRRRREVPILGGRVEGPRFNGTVLPGGADHQSVRIADGVATIEARQTLRHEDGTVIEMINTGVRRGPPEVLARLAAGEAVDPHDYYFRATPRFVVEPGPHGWLADSVFLCVGKRGPAGVELDIHQVL